MPQFGYFISRQHQGNHVDAIQALEAIQAYDKAIELKPDYEIAWNNKGIALKAQGKYGEALNTYDEAIRLDPNMPEPGTTKVMHSMH